MAQRKVLASNKKNSPKLMIPLKVKKAILAYLDLLKKDKVPLIQVILFGSYAKGKARKWSDVDLCLISPKFGDQIKATSYLLRKSTGIDAIIEPHPYHPEDFINEDPLVWEIKKTGVEIPL